LLPSSTEIVCALGFEKQLVGRSHECDFPASIKRLPVCTEPKFKTEGTSIELHEQVTEIVKDALSVYRVKTEVLEKLKPNYIITQDQCEVCAVSVKDVEQAVCELTSSKPEIVSLNPNSLDDVWNDIKRVGKTLGTEERSNELVAELKQRMERITKKARVLKSRPRIACIEWLEPPMAAGNWMPELIEIAGGISLFGEAGKHSPWMKFRDLIQKDPDIIIVTPCGFNISRTLEEMHLLSGRKEWESLRAVRTGNVFVADGNQYFNRPGPRLVESLEILAEIFHPNAFNFGYEKKGWVRFNVKGAAEFPEISNR